MTSTVHRSAKAARNLGAIASGALVLATLNGCDGDNFYPGMPLSDANVTLAATRLPDSASMARIVYTARWRIPEDDFRRYPYLLEIKNSSTGQRTDIHPASATDSARANFVCTGAVCEPGSFAATVFAQLEKGKLLAVGYANATVPR